MGPWGPYEFLQSRTKHWLHTYDVPAMSRQTRPSGGFQASRGMGCGETVNMLTVCDYRERWESWEEGRYFIF